MASANSSTPSFELNPAGMEGTVDEVEEERARVRAGSMANIGRLLLYSPQKHNLDKDNFASVSVNVLRDFPWDVKADRSLSVEARMEVRTLLYVGAGCKEWDSCVFGRAEKGEFRYRPAADLAQITESGNF